MNDSERTPQHDTAIWPEQMTRWLQHVRSDLVAAAALRHDERAPLAVAPSPRQRNFPED